jgi:hypothetical protein
MEKIGQEKNLKRIVIYSKMKFGIQMRIVNVRKEIRMNNNRIKMFPYDFYVQHELITMSSILFIRVFVFS